MVAGLAIALPLDVALGLFGGDAGLILGRYGTAPVVALGGLLAAIAHRYAGGREPGPAGRRSRESAALRSVAMCCRTSCARSSATAGDSASRPG